MTYSCKGGKSQKSVMHVPGCCFANVPEWAGLTGCALISSWLTPRAVHTLHARREYKLFSRGNSWHHRSAYGVRSRTKSILRFRGLGNTSSLRNWFNESLSVVFVASIPCLKVVASLVSPYCFFFGAPLAFLRGVAMGLCRRCVIFMSSVIRSLFRRLGYILGQILNMRGHILYQLYSHTFYHQFLAWYLVTMSHCYSVTLLPCYPVYPVPLLPCYLVTLLTCYPVTLLPCHLVTLLPYYTVTLLPCYTVTLLLCYLVTLLPCYLATLLPCYPVTLLLCYFVTLLRCYLVTLLPCYSVTLLPCYIVTLLPWHLVTQLPWYPITLLPCHLVTLSPCYLVTLLPCYQVTLLPC